MEERKLFRHGVIIDCDEEFETKREESFAEIAARRIKEWEIRKTAYLSMENLKIYTQQSKQC